METITFPPPPPSEATAALRDALRPAGSLPLVITYDGRTIQSGYHVTEVKVGAFVTIDCGGNPDSWTETVLQVEDLPGSVATPHHMPVRKLMAVPARRVSPPRPPPPQG